MFFTSALMARAAKRLGFTRLTTKRAKKGYYKGKGAISTGRHTKAGKDGGGEGAANEVGRRGVHTSERISRAAR